MRLGATEMTRRGRNFPKMQEIEINDLSIKGIATDKSDARPPPALSSPIKDPEDRIQTNPRGTCNSSYIFQFLFHEQA